MMTTRPTSTALAVPVEQPQELAAWLPGQWTEIGWLPPEDLSLDAYIHIGDVLATVEPQRDIRERR